MKKIFTTAVLGLTLLFSSVNQPIIYAEEENNEETEEQSEVLNKEENSEVENEDNNDLDIVGEYAIGLDGLTGEILYEKNSNELANPASITKVMTAILLDEMVEDGEMIEVSENARIQECSCFVFEEGEKISKEEALKAMLIISGNDVAMAIAEHISGSKEEFGELMTEKAEEFGAKDTTFTTPSGLTEEKHKTTAYDMAMILKEALNHPNVVHAMNLSEAKIKTDNRTVDVYRHGTREEDDRVLGSKTGYTDAAQHTYVEIYQEDEKIVLVAVMKSSKDGKFSDAKKIANYSLDKIQTKEIVSEKEKITTIKVNGIEVPVLAEEEFVLTYNKDFEKEIKVKKVINKDIKSVKKGQVVGKVQVYYKEELVKEIDLISDKEVVIEEKKNYNWAYVFLLVLIPIIGYIIYVIRFNRNKRKKYINK